MKTQDFFRELIYTDFFLFIDNLKKKQEFFEKIEPKFVNL